MSENFGGWSEQHSTLVDVTQYIGATMSSQIHQKDDVLILFCNIILQLDTICRPKAKRAGFARTFTPTHNEQICAAVYRILGCICS